MKLPPKMLIRQKVHAVEILTGFEAKNKYEVLENGKPIMYAYEESNWFFRNLLRRLAPLKMNIIGADKKLLLVIHKKFRLWFPKFTLIMDGKEFATIQTAGFFYSKFKISCGSSNLLCETKRAWMPSKKREYVVTKEGRVIATIRKLWGGAAKEFFTDADNFELELSTTDEKERWALLAAVFAIDFAVFEK